MAEDDSRKAGRENSIHDEPGMAERFQRALRNLVNTPPKPRRKPGRQKEAHLAKRREPHDE